MKLGRNNQPPPQDPPADPPATGDAERVDRFAALADARAAGLQELLSIVQNGGAPFWPGLPQVDLASRWYVSLASKVEEVCERLGIAAE